MREFRNKRSQLTSLSWGTRYIYTLFLLFSLASYAVMVVMMVTRSGLSGGALADYFAGNEAAGKYAKTFGELVELTHFHLFSMPVLLLVQGHIFMMTAWKDRAKMAVVTASFVGGALYIAAPWLVTYVSPGFSHLLTLARVLLMGCLTLYLVVPMREMWGGRREVGDPKGI